MLDAIGLCTWIFGHQRHGEIAAAAAELGCAGVELHVPLDGMSTAELRRVYASHGLRILSLTPENVDLIHQDPHLRQRAQKYYRCLINLAAELEAPAITIHEFVGRGPAAMSDPQSWQWLQRTLFELVDHAERRGIDLLLEPLQPPLVSLIHQASDAVRLCAEVGSPRLRVVLDTFHMDATERDVDQAIRLCKGSLAAVQLADRQRSGLGLGGIDLDSYFRSFRAIGFQGPWILECTAGLMGPSLQEQEVNHAKLRVQLEVSNKELRRLLTEHPALVDHPAVSDAGDQRSTCSERPGH